MPASARRAVQFSCSACGAVSPRWEGRCATCHEWNTLVEEAAPRGASRPAMQLRGTPVAPLGDVPAEGVRRMPSGVGELDRVLGGGIVPGSLILLGGDPGIGKSTLALQVAERTGGEGAPSLYCAGEESPAQLAMRASRLGCRTASVGVVPETDLAACIAVIERERPPLAIVDSVQTLQSTDVAGHPGSPSQVREAVGRLMACAKSSGVPILLIGHVTKDGAIAGPRTLEHMVDVVLYLEGERHGEHRLLRGIKNRFGATGELGLFTMTGDGMTEVEAPGRAFLDEATLAVPGNVLTVTCEGSRPLVVEVQALTATTAFGLPRRTASGIDTGRLHLLLAVLERRARVSLAQSDVYVNAVGGVRLGEPAADLAVALAIASAAADRRLDEGCIAVGEVGLGGEIRRVARLEARLAEAAALGITDAIVPAAHRGRAPEGVRCHPVATVSEALRLLR